MSIEANLVSHLSGVSAVTDLVSTRIYVGHVFSTIEFPMVQIRGTGGAPVTDLGGLDNLQNRIFQFDCYALNESTAAEIAREVMKAASGKQANFTGHALEAPISSYEDEYSAHRLTFEMSIWFY